MELVEPKVVLAAATATNPQQYDDIKSYLTDIGVSENGFEFNAPTDAEQLVTIGGKLCYKSFEPKLNPNVSKVRENNAEYIGNINAIGHGSVIEHAYITFIIWNCSRVFTHEVCRHRAGTAMSQESLRFVRLTDLGFWMPNILKEYDNENEDGQQLIIETIKYLEEVQKKLADIYNIEDINNFSLKKKLTSAFRRVAPIGLSTAIMYTMNFRAARHIIQMRTSRHAEEEIRLIFAKIARKLVGSFPNMFRDMSCEMIDGYEEWTSEYAAMPYDADKIKRMQKEIDELKEKLLDAEKHVEV